MIWLTLLCVGTIALEIPLRGWWVEDAAIAFSYARNLALGDGLVPFPGGERVEGYSDALWIVLLAGARVLGGDPFLFAKLFGGLLAAVCVPLTWAIAARIPVPTRHPWLVRAFPLIAATLVAANAQHAIWASAGLENSLFSVLLACGILRVLVESERGGVPWSAFAYFGLAITRPEGIAYAALGLVIGAWADLRAGRWSRIVVSFLAFSVPFLAYHAARYAYFAYPYPMTYYTKVEAMSFRPFAWEARSWKYLRRWSTELGWFWMLPVVFASLAGTRSWRALIAALWTVGLGYVLMNAGGGSWATTRVVALMATAVVLPALTLGRTGWAARLLCVGSAVAAVAFEVRAGGDWMSGYRFLSFLVVPLTVLYAVGVAEIGARLPKVLAGVVVLVGTLAPATVNVVYAIDYASHPEQSPQSVGQRVDYYNKIAAKVHLDRPWVAVDHSMGGMTWWAPPQGRSIDPFGLTDVPFALHRDEKAFRKPYILSPPLFDFAYVKEGAGTLYQEEIFRDRFVRLAAYRSGRRVDRNAWINRRLLTASTWGDTARQVVFTQGWRLEGFHVRASEVSVQGGLYVELGLSRDPSNPADFSVRVFLTGPKTVEFRASPGYDKMLPPSAWRDGEVFVGRYSFPLPKDLPAGAYTIGFIVEDEHGVIQAAETVPEGAVIGDEDAVLAPGEVRFADIIDVMPDADVRALGEADWTRALAFVAEGDCAKAEGAWLDAVKRRSRDARWGAALRARAVTPLAECWSALALQDTDLGAQLEDLAASRRWDARSPSALVAGRQIADALWPEAMAAKEAGDLEQTLRLFEAAVTADPTRVWARRYAEDARAVLLERGAGGHRDPDENEDAQ